MGTVECDIAAAWFALVSNIGTFDAVLNDDEFLFRIAFSHVDHAIKMVYAFRRAFPLLKVYRCYDGDQQVRLLFIIQSSHHPILHEE